jgi:hypothetical protein
MKTGLSKLRLVEKIAARQGWDTGELLTNDSLDRH